jgi:DNA replication protein DnaC
MISEMCNGLGYSGKHVYIGDNWDGIGLCPECIERKPILIEQDFNKITTNRQKDMSFNNFKVTQDNKKQVLAIQTYLKEITEQGLSKSMILWSSRCGTGKTHLVVSLLREYIKYGISNDKFHLSANMITESEMLDKVRASYGEDNKESESKIINSITNKGLVVIDDVGKVTSANLDFLHRIYFLIIDRIYGRKTNLIITSNLGMSTLSGHVGEACMSRLYEMTQGNIIEFIGKDFRVNYKGDR